MKLRELDANPMETFWELGGNIKLENENRLEINFGIIPRSKLALTLALNPKPEVLADLLDPETLVKKISPCLEISRF